MNRHYGAALAAASILIFGTGRAAAQAPAAQWTPPGRSMPAMPAMAELGQWQRAVGPWFRGVDAVTGIASGEVSAKGETTGGNAQAKFVRFSAGARPVAVWTDRNGDGRCDSLELYRDGSVVVQVLDPDYDGSANVVRLYDAGGKLAREDRL